MPLLFSIGIQGALEEVARSLEPGEQLCAFLDDVYLLCQPSRVNIVHGVVRRVVETRRDPPPPGQDQDVEQRWRHP